MEWSNKAVRQFIILCLLLGFGSTYLILDYSSLPNTESLMWEGEFKKDVDYSFGEPDKSFKIGLGDGFISNIEMIFIHLSLIFGMYECIDFAMCFEKKKTVDVKAYITKMLNRKKDNIDKETK